MLFKIVGEREKDFLCQMLYILREAAQYEIMNRISSDPNRSYNSRSLEKTSTDFEPSVSYSVRNNMYDIIDEC